MQDTELTRVTSNTFVVQHFLSGWELNPLSLAKQASVLTITTTLLSPPDMIIVRQYTMIFIKEMGLVPALTWIYSRGWS